MGIKGSWKRPRTITKEEEDLRWLLIDGELSEATFNRRYAKLKRAGLIRRSGQILQ